MLWCVVRLRVLIHTRIQDKPLCTSYIPPYARHTYPYAGHTPMQVIHTPIQVIPLCRSYIPLYIPHILTLGLLREDVSLALGARTVTCGMEKTKCETLFGECLDKVCDKVEGAK